jgi:predicted unusual protein kinase regulating ubiquinone biosynthesis (AarF/ABC1/UbiB family)
MISSRYRRILWSFGRILLHLLWWDVFIPKIGFRRLSSDTRPRRLRQMAARFRQQAVQMGGVMIKVGQFLSARLDVLPREITEELAGLQDEVRPEPFDAIRQVIETELKAPVDASFDQFQAAPLASASIGQVHPARLRGGENAACLSVVVKVQRPNIQQIVDTDLAALRVVSRWVQAYPPVSRRVNTPALLEEFSRSLYEETDYLHEGKNGETFAANFAGRPEVRVPRICWNTTTRRVLTQEEIRGIKITDYAAIEAAGIDRAEVANRLFDTYLKQIFEDRFFHADPHPGNLFILPSESTGVGPAWQLVFVDFGMTGVVTDNLFAGLREMIIAVGTRDVPRVVQAYQKMGILLPGADTELLEKAGERLFERFWGKSTTEIVNLGQQEAVEFAREFGNLLYELPFQIPENLILLGRCMGILSGICTGLNPDFNVWERVMPYASRLVSDDQQGASVWLQEFGRILQSAISLPRRTEALLQRIEQGRLEVQTPDLKEHLSRIDQSVQRISKALVFAALLLAGVQLHLAQQSSLALPALAAAVLAFVWLLYTPQNR